MPKQPTNQRQNEIISYIVVIAVMLAMLAAIIYIYKAQSLTLLPAANISATPTPRVQLPTPTPRAIPHGKWGFAVTTSQNGPIPGKGLLDPYDPSPGSRQRIVLHFADTVPVRAASVVVSTDHKSTQPIPFTRINGTELSGDWEASWTVNDTYLYTYVMKFTAQSSKGTTTVISTFR